ncbi:EAL domain-containing protein [soil metagenome]
MNESAAPAGRGLWFGNGRARASQGRGAACRADEAARPVPSASRTLSFQATSAVIVSCLLAVLPLAAVAIWSVGRVDGYAAERERTLFERGLKGPFETVSREQQSTTIWNDAVAAARAGDLGWISENLGVWMHSFYGHDRILVLDANDRPIYAMAGGEDLPAAAMADIAAVRPLLADIRARLARNPDLHTLTVRGVLTVAGLPSLVSIAPIVPDTETDAAEIADIHLHVSVRHLGDAFLARIADRYLLGAVALRDEPAQGPLLISVPLVGAEGDILGHLTWEADHPGRTLLMQLAPGLALTGLTMLLLVWYLLARLRRALGSAQSRAEQVQHLAFHDTLTGLPNRSLFNERLDAALTGIAAAKGRLALHYIDLDRFKHINDTLGHPAGDELIRQVGARLAAIVDDGETVARLGGDEFAILQNPLRSAADAERRAARILAAIRRPFELFGDPAHVDASIGIGIAPDAATTRSELMRKANIALYEAKGTGKGRQCTFEMRLDDIVSQKRAIERDLREALDRGTGFRLLYQPLYAADGERLFGAEALIRWDHPSYRAMSPGTFISVAEERGLMVRLGGWILREACATARALDLPWIAVNVSAVQFREPSFVDEVLATLSECRLSPERLQIEITESLLLDGADAIAMALCRLRFAGVHIALDDFGTGYSSLQYLHRFKVDKIKIDRSFVQNLGTGKEGDAIVQAMLDLASALRLDATAEGVETVEQWRLLQSLGAPEMQGYLFARPLEVEALRRLFQAGGDAARRPAASGATA